MIVSFVTYLLCLLSNELSSDFIIEFYVDSNVSDSHSLTVGLSPPIPPAGRIADKRATLPAALHLVFAKVVVIVS